MGFWVSQWVGQFLQLRLSFYIWAYISKSQNGDTRTDGRPSSLWTGSSWSERTVCQVSSLLWGTQEVDSDLALMFEMLNILFEKASEGDVHTDKKNSSLAANKSWSWSSPLSHWIFFFVISEVWWDLVEPLRRRQAECSKTARIQAALPPKTAAPPPPKATTNLYEELGDGGT